MYVCPTCGRAYKSEEAVAKCMLACWRKEHPYYQSKPAPRGEDVNTREINNDIMNFFSSLQKENT